MQMLDVTSGDLMSGCGENTQLLKSIPGKPVRFLLLSDPRTGTQMLANALEAFPCVRLFNLYSAEPDSTRLPHYHVAWARFQYQKLSIGVTHLGSLHHRVGIGWLERCTVIQPERYWQMIAERHDRFICLRRRNLLRQLLSRKVGSAIKSYDVLRPRSEKPQPTQVKISPSELARFAEAMEWLHGDIDELMADRFDIEYESLRGSWTETFREIQRYLDLPAWDIPPVTFVQEDRPLCEAIENFDEIRHWAEANGHGDWID